MGFRDHPFAYNPRGKLQTLLGYRDANGNGPLYLPAFQRVHESKPPFPTGPHDFVSFAPNKPGFEAPEIELPAIHVKFGPSTLSEQTISKNPVLEERFNVTITAYAGGYVDDDDGAYYDFKSNERDILERYLGGIQHIICFNISNGVYSLHGVTTNPKKIDNVEPRSAYQISCPGYEDADISGLTAYFDTKEGVFSRVSNRDMLKLVAFEDDVDGWRFYILKKFRGIDSIASGVSAFPTNLSYNVDAGTSNVGIYGNVDIIYSVITYFVL